MYVPFTTIKFALYVKGLGVVNAINNQMVPLQPKAFFIQERRESKLRESCYIPRYIVLNNIQKVN